MVFPDISWAACGVAAGVNFFVGGVWYGVFGAAWMKELGFTKEMIRHERWPMPSFLIAGLAAVAHALALAVVLGWARPDGVAATLAVAAGLGVVAALATGKHEAFGRKTWTLFAVDGGNDVVGFLAMGLVFGLWPAAA